MYRNGYRTPDGKFASPTSSMPRSGKAAEESVWNNIEQKPGWSVTRGEVNVRGNGGQLRKYDGVATSPSGNVIGIETKSGGANRDPAQRSFDTWLNSSNANTANGVGASKGISVQRSILTKPESHNDD